MDKKNIVTIVIIVVASLLIVGAFIYFGRPGSVIQSGLSSPGSPMPATTQGLSSELLRALSSLESLTLNTDLFKDSAFTNLVDYSKDIKDEPVGRDNPFMPVGTESSSGTQTNNQSVQPISIFTPKIVVPISSSTTPPISTKKSSTTNTTIATSTVNKSTN